MNKLINDRRKLSRTSIVLSIVVLLLPLLQSLVSSYLVLQFEEKFLELQLTLISISAILFPLMIGVLFALIMRFFFLKPFSKDIQLIVIVIALCITVLSTVMYLPIYSEYYIESLSANRF